MKLPNEYKRISKPITISFSGIDGAGKSTQIANLIAHFQAIGCSVRLITFWDDVVMLKDLREGAGHKVFKGDKGVGSPDAPIQRRDKNVRSPWITLFRMAFYCLDALSLRRISRRAKEANPDVIIFDRYLFDELANLDFSNPIIRLYVQALLRLAPTPTISFILDANPEQAYARKPEYPLEFLHENRSSYLRLNQIIGGTVIPASSIQVAKEAVIGHVLQNQKEYLPLTSGSNPLIQP